MAGLEYFISIFAFSFACSILARSNRKNSNDFYKFLYCIDLKK